MNTSSGFLFEGVAWLLQERKTTFYAPRYSQESLLIRRQVLPFWSQPQAVLQLGEHGEFVVLSVESSDAAKLSGDNKETKKLLKVTARAMDDLHRAQKYQTAARTQTLELFVDVEHTRERLLRCLRAPNAEIAQKQIQGSAGKKMLDDAFAALERAQQSRERDAALRLYKEAEKGFYEAEQAVSDDRSREFLRARRGDLQRTIRGLEEEIQSAEVVRETAAVLPREPQVDVVTAPVTTDISARLEELRRFAAQQDREQEQQQPTDLAARLAALKNEKEGRAPPMDDLAERLRRLRGENAPAETTQVPGYNNMEKKSAVERIIEQVSDEIALGIEDEEIDEEKDLAESDSDSDRSSSDSSSSSQSSNSTRSKTRNERGKCSSQRKKRQK